MKKRSFSMETKVLCTAALALVLMTGSKRTAAQTGTLKKPEITYIGSHKEFLEFSINLKNEISKNFFLEIYDDAHRVLYRNKFTGAAFRKRIYLYKEADYEKVTFRVRSGKKRYEETFAVNQSATGYSDITKW